MLQPVTPEELLKASNRISPLALSMVKPPDPELMACMSLKEQREFMANWAEKNLQDASTQKSKPDTRRSSEEDIEKKSTKGKTNILNGCC